MAEVHPAARVSTPRASSQGASMVVAFGADAPSAGASPGAPSSSTAAMRISTTSGLRTSGSAVEHGAEDVTVHGWIDGVEVPADGHDAMGNVSFGSALAASATTPSAHPAAPADDDADSVVISPMSTSPHHQSLPKPRKDKKQRKASPERGGGSSARKHRSKSKGGDGKAMPVPPLDTSSQSPAAAGQPRRPSTTHDDLPPLSPERPGPPSDQPRMSQEIPMSTHSPQHKLKKHTRHGDSSSSSSDSDSSVSSSTSSETESSSETASPSNSSSSPSPEVPHRRRGPFRRRSSHSHRRRRQASPSSGSSETESTSTSSSASSSSDEDSPRRKRKAMNGTYGSVPRHDDRVVGPNEDTVMVPRPPSHQSPRAASAPSNGRTASIERALAAELRGAQTSRVDDHNAHHHKRRSGGSRRSGYSSSSSSSSADDSDASSSTGSAEQDDLSSMVSSDAFDSSETSSTTTSTTATESTADTSSSVGGDDVLYAKLVGLPHATTPAASAEAGGASREAKLRVMLSNVWRASRARTKRSSNPATKMQESAMQELVVLLLRERHQYRHAAQMERDHRHRAQQKAEDQQRVVDQLIARGLSRGASGTGAIVNTLYGDPAEARRERRRSRAERRKSSATTDAADTPSKSRKKRRDKAAAASSGSDGHKSSDELPSEKKKKSKKSKGKKTGADDPEAAAGSSFTTTSAKRAPTAPLVLSQGEGVASSTDDAGQTPRPKPATLSTRALETERPAPLDFESTDPALAVQRATAAAAGDDGMCNGCRPYGGAAVLVRQIEQLKSERSSLLQQRPQQQQQHPEDNVSPTTAAAAAAAAEAVARRASASSDGGDPEAMAAAASKTIAAIRRTSRAAAGGDASSPTDVIGADDAAVKTGALPSAPTQHEQDVARTA